MKIRTIIIEDEINARKALKNMLQFYCDEVEIIGETDKVAEGIQLIRESKPDLVILDVHLTDGTGFDVMEKTRSENFKVIFSTAYDEYALQAIKISALDYLLKPVKPNELRKAIQKAVDAIENDEMRDMQVEACINNVHSPAAHKKVILNTLESIHMVETGKIIRCEGSDNYTNVYIENKDRLLISKTLKEFEELLNPFGFFRVHQSHIINLHNVDLYDKKSGGMAVLNDGSKIPVSSRRKEGFLKALAALT